MNHAADAFSNPFIVDDQTAPPLRSAFAVLNAERDDLLEKSVEEVLERSLRVLENDPDLATVYGRPVTEKMLHEAAKRLIDPKSRVVNELLDYRYHRFDLGSLDELRDAVDSYKESLAADGALEVVDVSVLGRLFSELLEAPVAPASPHLHVDAPGLPPMAELLDGLA